MAPLYGINSHVMCASGKRSPLQNSKVFLNKKSTFLESSFLFDIFYIVDSLYSLFIWIVPDCFVFGWWIDRG